MACIGGGGLADFGSNADLRQEAGTYDDPLGTMNL